MLLHWCAQCSRLSIEMWKKSPAFFMKSSAHNEILKETSNRDQRNLFVQCFSVHQLKCLSWWRKKSKRREWEGERVLLSDALLYCWWSHIHTRQSSTPVSRSRVSKAKQSKPTKTAKKLNTGTLRKSCLQQVLVHQIYKQLGYLSFFLLPSFLWYRLSIV